MNMEVPGIRRRGRPRMRWRDTVNRDMQEKNVSEVMVHDRRRWRRLITNSDPISRWEKLKIKKKKMVSWQD